NSDSAMLGGYKGNIDLSVISHGKPLQSGEYDAFIKLEQMFQDNDKVKFEKLISLSNVREFMRNDILNTKLNYFSASKVMKYNLLVTFNKYSNTLQFKNTLLQEFDPRDMPDTVETKENKYIKKFKRVFFRMMYKFFCILPIQKSKVTFASDSRSEL